MDENRYQPRKQLISHHEDELPPTPEAMAEGEKPEDYLNEFKSFILDNMNKIPALAIICQRPRELTRQDLRSSNWRLISTALLRTKTAHRLAGMDQ